MSLHVFILLNVVEDVKPRLFRTNTIRINSEMIK